MAKKRLNKRLLSVILLVGLGLLVVGVITGVRYKFRDPQPFLDKGILKAEEAARQEQANIEQAAQKSDPKEAYEYLKELNEGSSQKMWKEAIESLQSAYKYSRANMAVKKEAASKLAEVYWQDKQYAQARGVWNKLYELDRDDYEAKKKSVDFIYQLAKYGAYGMWSEVRREAQELIEANERLDRKDATGYVMKAHAVLGMLESKAEKEVEAATTELTELLTKALEIDGKNSTAYYLKARQLLLDVQGKSEAELGELRRQAGALVQEAVAAHPEDVEGYQNWFDVYLFPAVMEKYQQARKSWQEEMNLRREERRAEGAEKLRLAQEAKTAAAQKERLLAEAERILGESVSQLDALAGRFAEEGSFLRYKSRLWYAGSLKRSKANLDKAIELLEAAYARPKKDVMWSLELGEYYQERAEWSAGEAREDLTRGFEVLYEALYSEEMLDLDSPRQVRIKNVRWRGMIPLLVETGESLLKVSEDEAQRAKVLAVMESSYEEVRDRVGLTDPFVRVVGGRLAMSKGQREEGIRLLYEADKQFQESGMPNGSLKKELFYGLRGGAYQSLAVQYAADALGLGERSPRLFLDYFESRLQVSGETTEEFLRNLEDYEWFMGEGDAEYERLLRLKAAILVRLQRFDEAGEILAQIPGDSLELQKLRAQAQKTMAERVSAYEQIVAANPGDMEGVSALMNYYLSQASEDPGYFEKVRALLAKAIAESPENIAFTRLVKILAEPDPMKVSEPRLRAITLEVLEGVSDPFQRAKQLGDYYQQMALAPREKAMRAHAEAEQARLEGNSELETKYRQEESAAREELQGYLKQAAPYFSQAWELRPEDPEVQRSLFRTALLAEDWARAEQLVGQVSQQDRLAGLEYEAELKITQGDETYRMSREATRSKEDQERLASQARELWGVAEDRLERYLGERPLAVTRRLQLGQVYQKLDRRDEAILAVREALAMERNRPEANSFMMELVHLQNMEAGTESIGINEISEMFGYLQPVLGQNPNDTKALYMMVMYSSLLSERLSERLADTRLTGQERASLEQEVARRHEVSVQTCRRLIGLDSKNIRAWQLLVSVLRQRAGQLPDESQKQQMDQEIRAGYKEALSANPGSADLMADYAGYLRNAGESAESEKLLAEMAAGSEGEQKYEVQIKQAVFYGQQEDYARAETILKEVLAAAPGHRTAELTLAELYVKQERYGEALSLFEALRARRDDERMLRRHIEILLDAGRLPEAETRLTQMQQRYPEYIGTPILQATLELRKSNYAAAVQYLDQVLAQNPGHQKARLAKAEALYYDGQLQRSLETLLEIRGGEPVESNEGRMLLSQVYRELNRPSQALNELETMVRNEPDDQRAREVLIQLLAEQGRWSQLESLYESTVSRYPKVVRWYVSAGQASLSQAMTAREGKDDAAVQKHLSRSIEWLRRGWQVSREQGEGPGPAFGELLRVYLLAQQYNEVVKLVDQNLTGGPIDNLYLLRKAAAFYRLGQTAEALATFEQVLGGVTDLEASSIILSEMMGVGDDETLTKWAQEKIAQRPDWVVGYIALGQLQARAGDNASAITNYLTAQSKADEELSLRIENQLAFLYQRNDESDKAIASYRKVLAKRPDDVTSMNNLAYLLLDKTQGSAAQQEALTLAEKAYTLYSNNPNLMDTYALALLRQGDYEKSEEMLRRAIQEFQRKEMKVPVEFYLHLAEALMGLDRKSDAQNFVTKGLETLDQQPAGADTQAVREQLTKLNEQLN